MLRGIIKSVSNFLITMRKYNYGFNQFEMKWKGFNNQDNYDKENSALK